MATVAPSSDQATDLLQKLSLDSQTKTVEAPDVTKKPSAIQYGSAGSGEVASMQIPSFERSATPLLPDFFDPNMCYLPNGYPPAAYYYGNYDGSFNEWDDYSRYANPDGVDMPPHGVYGDNGSLMYHHGYGYPPYAAYPPAGSPVPTMGHDGQLYGPQTYQYAGPYYHPTTPPGPPYTSNQANTPQGEVATSVSANQVHLSVETPNGNAKGISNGTVNGNNGSVPLRPSFPNSYLNSKGSFGRGVLQQDTRFGFDGIRSPAPWIDGPIFSDRQNRPATSTSVSSAVSHISNISSTRNQNLRPLPHLMGLHSPGSTAGMGPTHGFMDRMYPHNRMYRTDAGFASNGYDSRTNGRGWLAVDTKYKPRNRGNMFLGNGNENTDGLNELNRGPRAGRFKNQKGLAPNITLAVKGQNLSSNSNNEDAGIFPNRDQYNQAEFCVKYSNAKFFVIKSYSEDDIHKSIKYSVWASTPTGNKKLDAGYQEAQEKSGGCPVFLFFSVNTSGQFVGVAEMLGPVDFNKNVEYWQQDKWNGCFPVKWHIVKDVPNNLLKHITLENNDNKPVTNSRDTQEVKLEQGLEMLNIFKDYTSKTCILDDFGFYESRQKTMQEKRAKQPQFQKQVWDGKPTDTAAAAAAADEKDTQETDTKSRLLQKPLELDPEKNSLVSGVGDDRKGAKIVTEKKVVSNGVVNGC